MYNRYNSRKRSFSMVNTGSNHHNSLVQYDINGRRVRPKNLDMAQEISVYRQAAEQQLDLNASDSLLNETCCSVVGGGGRHERDERPPRHRSMPGLSLRHKTVQPQVVAQFSATDYMPATANAANSNDQNLHLLPCHRVSQSRNLQRFDYQPSSQSINVLTSTCELERNDVENIAFEKERNVLVLREAIKELQDRMRQARSTARAYRSVLWNYEESIKLLELKVAKLKRQNS